MCILGSLYVGWMGWYSDYNLTTNTYRSFWDKKWTVTILHGRGHFPVHHHLSINGTYSFPSDSLSPPPSRWWSLTPLRSWISMTQMPKAIAIKSHWKQYLERRDNWTMWYTSCTMAPLVLLTSHYPTPWLIASITVDLNNLPSPVRVTYQYHLHIFVIRVGLWMYLHVSSKWDTQLRLTLVDNFYFLQ